MSNEEITSIIEMEGNFKEFKYKGYQCEIKRMPYLLHLCGYVYTHTDLPESIIDSLLVHGGITFSKFNSASGSRKIGFDCAHYGDLAPAMSYTYDCVYRNMNFVADEIKRLVEQLILIERDATPISAKEN